MMRSMFATLGLTFSLSLVGMTTALAQGSNSSPAPVLTHEKTSALMERVIGKVIQPGYRDFSEKSGLLTDRMMQLCTTPSSTNLDQAKTAFSEAAKSWARIEMVRVGPVLEKNRFERILFYPDKKGLGLRQVQALLAAPDDAATSPDTLSEKSVAVQGLGALEFLLYGTGSEELNSTAKSYRCRYGLAIAGNVQHIAMELVQAWDDPNGITKDWKNPGPQSATFRQDQEAVTEVLGILVHAAEALRDQRVESFYKGSDAQSFPKQALFWRSGLTFPMLSANLEGLRHLVHASDIKELLKPSQIWIVNSIDVYFKSLTTLAQDIDPNLETAVSTSQQKAKLDALLSDSRDLIILFNDDLGQALGLTTGFSFSDGD